jgi:hypothetical protein
MNIITSVMQGLFGASLSEIASYPGPLMAGELQQRAWIKAERALSAAGCKLAHKFNVS